MKGTHSINITKMDNTPQFGLQNVSQNIWPQRLLCVRDWTSYELRLQDGDAYYRKEDKNPQYAILSYTWGRFRADGKWGSSILPNAEAIEINGIPWNIPKMDPVKGFGRETFKRVLEVVAGRYDYVWVDVACINQGPDPDEHNQIGCQASIFNRASAAFIWLHQQGLGDGHSIADRISTLIAQIEEHGKASGQMTRDEQLEVEKVVVGLLYDPWFSSLWTLQESFLRKDATILSRNGEKTSVSWKGRKVELTLHILLEISHSFLELDGPPGNIHIRTPIIDAGLNTIMAHNPLVLLRAARHRTSKEMKDRILGIQQIFGVDVGEIGEQTQVQVEKRLSVAINERCPSLAQAFLHPYGVRDDRPKWQAHLGTFVPSKVYSSANNTLGAPDPMPHRSTRRGRFMGVTAPIEDTMFVPTDFYYAHEIESSMRAEITLNSPGDLQWTGLKFPLESLWAAWQEHERARFPPGLDEGKESGPNTYTMDGSIDPYRNAFDCSVYIDDSWVSTPQQIVNYLPAEFTPHSWPLMIVYQLCRSRPHQVDVLILGRIQSELSGQAIQSCIGLLVRKGGNQLVHRIGFCTWKSGITLDGIVQGSALLG